MDYYLKFIDKQCVIMPIFKEVVRSTTCLNLLKPPHVTVTVTVTVLVSTL